MPRTRHKARDLLAGFRRMTHVISPPRRQSFVRYFTMMIIRARLLSRIYYGELELNYGKSRTGRIYGCR